MHALRKLSPRPTLFVGDAVSPAAPVDPQQSYLGKPGPLGRGRIVSALPLQNGPQQLRAPLVVHSADLSYLADPDGNLIGVPGLWVHRLLSARWTEDTRRLGG